MNKHNAKDYLPFVQALAEGKTLQFRAFPDQWHDMADGMLFESLDPDRWRIKPDPVKGWYRVALMGEGITYWTLPIDSDSEEERAPGLRYFIRWLTDRIEYEV